MGLYFEELEIGKEYISEGRTITEADVVMFASLTGDFNSIHIDTEYSKTTIYGQPIAHGLLVLAYGMGLVTRTGFFTDTIIAFMEIVSWKFLNPIFLGDTIKAKFVIEEKISTKKTDRGIAVRRMQIINQDGKVVQEGVTKTMVKRKTGITM